MSVLKWIRRSDASGHELAGRERGEVARQRDLAIAANRLHELRAGLVQRE
jgi:hypothetical protein